MSLAHVTSCSPGRRPGASGILASLWPRGLGSFSVHFCLLWQSIWAVVLEAFWPPVGVLSQSCVSPIPAMSGPIREPSVEALKEESAYRGKGLCQTRPDGVSNEGPRLILLVSPFPHEGSTGVLGSLKTNYTCQLQSASSLPSQIICTFSFSLLVPFSLKISTRV